MCDVTPACKHPAKYWVWIPVMPQRLGDGSMEGANATRSQFPCRFHLATSVRELSELKIRRSDIVRVQYSRGGWN